MLEYSDWLILSDDSNLLAVYHHTNGEYALYSVNTRYRAFTIAGKRPLVVSSNLERFVCRSRLDDVSEEVEF